MKILFYTSGLSGIGRLVFGISIYNGFQRTQNKFDFLILSHASKFQAAALDKLIINHKEIIQEGEAILLTEKFEESELYNTITNYNPDILIVDRLWFNLFNFIDNLKCKKIFICSQINDYYFKPDIQDFDVTFKNSQYDRVFAIEPFKSMIEMEQLNPLIIRNRDEIFIREQALEGLGFQGEREVCFIGANFEPGYLEKIKEKYSYINEEGDYDVIYSTNMDGKGIFPLADYYNAIDLLICPPTYNHFWESRFFNKKAIFEKVPVRFCNLDERIKKFSEYTFKENGADQLADIIFNL